MATLAKEVEALLGALGEDSLTAVVDLGVLVAQADGSIDEAEQQKLGELLDGAFGGLVEPRLVRHFIREARARCESVGLEARAREVGGEVAKRGGATAALSVAIAIARASQGVSEPERALLAIVAAAAGVGEAELAAAIARA